MNHEGYIKLFRKIKDNALWLEPRKFSKAEAWIDILLRGSHKEVDIAIGMKIVRLKRGEFVTSQMKLAAAWGWNRETVKSFLDLLKSSNQASYESSNRNTIISIRKWDEYQVSNPATEPTTKRHQIRQQGDNKSSTINNDKNDKNNTTDTFLTSKKKKSFNKAELEMLFGNIVNKDILKEFLINLDPGEDDKIHRAVGAWLQNRWPADGWKVYALVKKEIPPNEHVFNSALSILKKSKKDTALYDDKEL